MCRGKCLFLISIITSIFVVHSCVDEYWPALLPKYENALVVEGAITSKPGPYIVKLSTSSNVETPIYKPLGGCKVSIYNSKGNSEILSEIEEGVYATSENGIQGKSGTSYRITIKTPEGKRYRSDFEEMAIPTEIDTVYTKIEYSPHPYYFRDITGFRFYVDTYVAEADTNYYVWDLETTYKFNANYRARYYWDGQMHPFSPSDSLYTCYKTVKVPEIFTYNTTGLSIPEITEYPLHIVTTETKELSIRYSLLVSQYSVTEQAAQFWNHIKSIDEEQGEMYTRQPFQVRGNVFNVENTEEPVLGYFMVAGLSEKRIFMDRPTGVDWHYQDSCNLYPVDMDVLWIHYNEWPLFLPAFFGEAGGYSPAWVDYQWCVDCTAKGSDGYLEKPDFWAD